MPAQCRRGNFLPENYQSTDHLYPNCRQPLGEGVRDVQGHAAQKGSVSQDPQESADVPDHLPEEKSPDAIARR